MHLPFSSPSPTNSTSGRTCILACRDGCHCCKTCMSSYPRNTTESTMFRLMRRTSASQLGGWITRWNVWGSGVVLSGWSKEFLGISQELMTWSGWKLLQNDVSNFLEFLTGIQLNLCAKFKGVVLPFWELSSSICYGGVDFSMNFRISFTSLRNFPRLTWYLL